jgi:hypothetical protein
MTNAINAAADFAFINGDNPDRTIENRFNTISSFVKNTAVCSVTSDVITIPVAQGNTDTEVLAGGGTFIPADSIITSIGILFIDLLDGGANAVFKVGFGPSTGDETIVAQTTLLDNAGSDITANQFASTSNGLIPGTGGAAMKIATGAIVFAESSAQSLFLRTNTTTNDLGATCKIKVVAEFIPYTTVS